MTCELCVNDGGEVLWRDERCRVILINDIDYPGFCRVIWQGHVREMTDLSIEERADLMFIVFTVEESLREILMPDKINLASLGNMTPHLHWHVIPRFADDKHFPGAIWGATVRESRSAPTVVGLLEKLRASLQPRLNSMPQIKAFRE